MSFFGFEEMNLEREKQQFQQASFEEEVPVFTWGEESYDGLGDALQEGGDELNFETFGNIGVVGTFFHSRSQYDQSPLFIRHVQIGKDFDFASVALPKLDHLSKGQAIPLQNTSEQAALDTKPNLQNYLDVATFDHDQSSTFINLQHANCFE
jgi:DNA topoisomerase 2-associated protein PAT1